MSLSLRVCTLETGLIKVFRDWQSACRHLCDHVLTKPEALAWRLLLEPQVAEILSSNARFRLAKQIWAEGDEGKSAQLLYDEYAKIICRSLASTSRTGWIWKSEDDDTVQKALGVWGVLVVFDKKVVRSAMLPGIGSAARTREARERETIGKNDEEDTGGIVESRRRNPLPREAEEEGFRSIRPIPFEIKRKISRKIESRKQQEKSTKNTSIEMRRFKLFKKCARFVRREIFGAYYKTKGRSDDPMALVKKIDFDSWLKLTSRFGGCDYDTPEQLHEK